MTRTEVAREVAGELHATEAAMEEVLDKAEATLARLVYAKKELGLTGTMGDAAIGRMRDTVNALHDARETLIESHRESYTVLKATNIRGVAILPDTVFEPRKNANVA